MAEVGRPKKYQSVEDMQTIIDAFFEDCTENKIHPTVTGLCLALDVTRKTLIAYEFDEKFLNTVKKAKLKVELAIEQTLLSGNAVAGAIFNLKNNFGWKDESRSTITHDFETALSDQERLERLSRYLEPGKAEGDRPPITH